MKQFKYVSLVVVALLLTSCYHAQIVTDKAPSNTVIDQPWASSFIFGLVPPPVVETASQCPNGVARVETQISFVNGLVSMLTFNLYTPMHITVTCAAGSGMSSADANIDLPEKATDKDVTKAINEAALQSADKSAPVYISFN